MPGTGERRLEVNFLKRIFAVEPSKITTYLNLNDPDDPKNANIEISMVQNPVFEGDAGFTGNVSINGILNCPQLSQAPFQHDLNEIKFPGLYHYEAVNGVLNTPCFSRNWTSIEIGDSGKYSQIVMPWDSGKATRY